MRRHECGNDSAVFGHEIGLQIAANTIALYRIDEPLPVCHIAPDFEFLRSLAYDFIARQTRQAQKAVIDIEIKTIGQAVDIDGIGAGPKRRSIALLALQQCGLRLLALGDVGPIAHDQGHVTRFITNQSHFIAHPAVAVITNAKTVLMRMLTPIKQLRQLFENMLPVVGVDVLRPKLSVLRKLLGRVAHAAAHVRANVAGAIGRSWRAGVERDRTGRHQEFQF